MKRKLLGKIFFIIIISNVLIFSSFSNNNVKGISNDMSFIFDNQIFYENNNITFDTPESSYNLKYQERYTELYNATYTFTNDTDGSIPSNWFAEIGGGTTAQIISNHLNHLKILELYDGHGVNNVIINTPISETSGTIEFWWSVNDATDGFYFNLLDGVAILIHLRFFDDKIQYFDGGYIDLVDPALNNNWYRIRIDFETGGGGYQGLLADTKHIIINGVNNSHLTFRAVGNIANNISFYTTGIHSNDYLYIDSLGYSWNNFYSISENLFPIINKSTSLKEVNKYEFALNDIHTFNVVGSDNPNGWTDIESPAGDKVNIANEFDGSYDRLIIVDTNVINDFRGIIRDNLGITGHLINITWGFFASILDGGSTDSFNIQVESSDATIILNCKIAANLSVFYGGSNPSTLTNVYRDIVIGENMRYDFNFLLDYELDTVYFIYSLNGVIQEIYHQPMTNSGKQGVKKINTGTILNTANTIRFYTDYIGIYNHGKSQVEIESDFGIAIIDILKPWNYQDHNIFTLIGNGTFHIGGSDSPYYNGEPFAPIKDTTIYNNNETIFLNIYDSFAFEMEIGRIVLTVSSNNFNFSYVRIEGVILNETGTDNSYSLKFSHGNVDTTESFFYVSQNKLRFIHNSNDTDLEFIQARFRINPISSSDISISFDSVIQDNAFGFFRVNFSDTSNLIQIPNIERTIRFILTQNLTINDLVILVSDRDDNSVSGYTTGNVHNIQFLITRNIGVSIITDSLINMMIPLIMIIIPTLALSNRYGKNVIIPMFILMSIICVASSLIPAWLFFVIAISCSLFIIKKDDIQ